MKAYRLTLPILVLPIYLVAAQNKEALIGKWDFSHANNQKVQDESGNGRVGEIRAAQFVEDHGRKVMAIDGIDGRVKIEGKFINSLSRGLTSAIWVKPRGFKNHTPLYGIPNPDPRWTTPVFGMFLQNHRAVYGQLGSDGSPKVLLSMSDALEDNVWVHLAATYDGENITLYVNGKKDTSTPHASPLRKSRLPLMIGNWMSYYRGSFHGKIGELCIYSRALDTHEIDALYQDTKKHYRSAKSVLPPVSKDDHVIVEVHGRSPEAKTTWVKQPTRLLQHLKGYQPQREKVELDQFGGSKNGIKFKATGYFYSRKHAGRHFLVTPEGHPYFYLGPCVVMPPRGEEETLRWAEAETARIRKAGFNGLGNRSSEKLQQVEHPLPWVLRANFMFEFARHKRVHEPQYGTLGFINQAMPVYEPDFEAFCMKRAKEMIAATANDPYLVGIMTDNELQSPVDLLDRYLSFEKDHNGRKAAERWLEQHHKEKVNGKITRRMRYQFIADTFERYYRIVTKAIRQHDTNHMYLGSRLRDSV